MSGDTETKILVQLKSKKSESLRTFLCIQYYAFVDRKLHYAENRSCQCGFETFNQRIIVLVIILVKSSE